MENIRESRFITITERIITADNLLRLARAVLSEYQYLSKKDKYTTVGFSVSCDDGSVFESEYLELFADDSPMFSKRVTHINMNCHSSSPASHIDVDIHHRGNIFDRESTIKVRGTDAKWVNGTLKRFDEIMERFAPQNNFVRKYYYLLQPVFAISIGAIIIRTLLLVYSLAPAPTESTDYSLLVSLAEKYAVFRYALLYFIYWLTGALPAIYLLEKLKSLWPTVEIQVGAEHKFIEKKRRTWLINALLIGVVPMIVQVIYDAVRYFSVSAP